MDKSQSPTFLYRPLPNIRDKLEAIEDLRRLALWQRKYGLSKPFDRQAAIALQGQLHAEDQARQLKQAKKMALEREKLEKESIELHRKVAESVLGVEVLGEDVQPNGRVLIGVKLRDVITGVSIGTPRMLLNEHRQFEWRTSVDCRTNLELHLDELRKKYDGFEHKFSFNRQDLKSGYRYKERYLTFHLRLFWKPSITVEAARKLKRLVTQTAK